MAEIVLIERDAAKMLDVPLERMEVLRQKYELPFIQVDRVRRVYFKSDIIEWLKGRRVVLS